jgi:hypothetical protein
MAKATKAKAPEVETPETETPEAKAPEKVDNPNQKQADALFAKFPHVHTIWFDKKGAWRFYEHPGAEPIERHKK